MTPFHTEILTGSRGVPDPVSSIPTIVVTGHYDPNVPLLPPRDPLYDLAELDNKCMIGPIVTVCVRDKRPPLPPSERLPSGPMPWFPQSWCDFANIFCTNGQEQHDNERIPDSETSGKTKAELDEICVKQNIVEINVCYANVQPKITGNWRAFKVCEQKANARMYACFRTAERLTDFGQHPAP